MMPAAKPSESRWAANVLLVEDEVGLRALLAEEMRENSLFVIEAANADEAWAYLQAGGTVDLLFTDVRMPGSIDGLELSRRVKAAYPHTQIILTSGNLGPRAVGDLARFLQKPYSIAKAVSTVIKLINGNPEAET